MIHRRTRGVSAVCIGVAVLLVSSLSCHGNTSSSRDGDGVYIEPKGRAESTLAIEVLPSLTDEFTVPPGVVEIAFSSFGGRHALVFAGDELRGFELLTTGPPEYGKVRLQPGTYTVYCTIPGHRQAGEEAVIRVPKTSADGR